MACLTSDPAPRKKGVNDVGLETFRLVEIELVQLYLLMAVLKLYSLSSSSSLCSSLAMPLTLELTHLER